jgi:hypothetical protein
MSDLKAQAKSKIINLKNICIYKFKDKAKSLKIIEKSWQKLQWHDLPFQEFIKLYYISVIDTKM